MVSVCRSLLLSRITHSRHVYAARSAQHATHMSPTTHSLISPPTYYVHARVHHIHSHMHSQHTYGHFTHARAHLCQAVPYDGPRRSQVTVDAVERNYAFEGFQNGKAWAARTPARAETHVFEATRDAGTCAAVRCCALYALVLVNYIVRRLRGCDEERARIIWRSIVCKMLPCMKCCN